MISWIRNPVKHSSYFNYFSKDGNPNIRTPYPQEIKVTPSKCHFPSISEFGFRKTSHKTISGINLNLKAAKIVQGWQINHRSRAGDTLEISVTLRPVRVFSFLVSICLSFY